MSGLSVHGQGVRQECILCLQQLRVYPVHGPKPYVYRESGRSPKPPLFRQEPGPNRGVKPSV